MYYLPEFHFDEPTTDNFDHPKGLATLCLMHDYRADAVYEQACHVSTTDRRDELLEITTYHAFLATTLFDQIPFPTTKL